MDVKTTFRPQKPHCKNFWWKHIKNGSCKCYLGNKKQKTTFLDVPIRRVLWYWATIFSRSRSGAQIKLCRRKIGRLERNLSIPTITISCVIINVIVDFSDNDTMCLTMNVLVIMNLYMLFESFHHFLYMLL